MQRKIKCVSALERERERDISGKKRLRLPAGKPVLISAGCQTHLLALFNIPIVKRDGLLLPLASERRGDYVMTWTLSQINLLSRVCTGISLQRD